MKNQVNQITENKSKSSANHLVEHQKGADEADSLPAIVGSYQLQHVANNSPQVAQLQAFMAMANDNKSPLSLPAVSVIQKKENKTGLPDQLKSGIEQLSGVGMDDVKVHTHSSKPAQLNAYAYAQGSDIHVAPDQEKYLPHEAWHVAQQKQGKVQATTQLKGIAVNDDAALEKEADVMGAKALTIDTQTQSAAPIQRFSISTPVLQGAFTAGDPATYDADGGHGYGDHGWLTTELQHKERLETGKAPSGRVADIPDASSKFASSAIMTNAVALAMVDAAKPTVSDKTGKKGGKKARLTLAYNTAKAGISYSLDKTKVPPAVVSSTVDWVVIVLKNPPAYDEIVTMFPSAGKPGATDN